MHALVVHCKPRITDGAHFLYSDTLIDDLAMRVAVYKTTYANLKGGFSSSSKTKGNGNAKESSIRGGRGVKKGKTIDKKSDIAHTPSLLESIDGLVTALPLLKGHEDGELSEDLCAYAEILREFVLIDLLCQYLAHCCQNVTSTSLTCFERCFSLPKNVGVLKRLVEDLYVPVQRELAATRENTTFVKSLIEDTMAVPEEVKFRLLVTADTVVVKETLDDSSPRTCKLERGTIVDAYDAAAVLRGCSNTGQNTAGYLTSALELPIR